jgi:folate-dependent tRNA-U54 methylase TrmFO/GidA
MNVNHGLFPPLAGLPRRGPKALKQRRMAERALADLEPFARASEAAPA